MKEDAYLLYVVRVVVNDLINLQQTYRAHQDEAEHLISIDVLLDQTRQGNDYEPVPIIDERDAQNR